MKQQEAAKDNALAEASAMTKTEAANLAWAKEGQIFISCVQRNHLGTFGVFLCLLMSTWLTWTPYFLEVYFCICFFVYFLYVL